MIENQRDQTNKLESIRIKLNFFTNFEVDTYFTYLFQRGPLSINLALVKQIKANLATKELNQWKKIIMEIHHELYM